METKKQALDWVLFTVIFIPLRNLVEQMKKQGPNIIPEDYKKLQEEVLRLKCELKREKLRADFYEEMVTFGKEVYGIDLKKAGTK